MPLPALSTNTLPFQDREIQQAAVSPSGTVACGERYYLPDPVLHGPDQPIVEITGPDRKVPENRPVQRVTQATQG